MDTSMHHDPSSHSLSFDDYHGSFDSEPYSPQCQQMLHSTVEDNTHSAVEEQSFPPMDQPNTSFLHDHLYLPHQHTMMALHTTGNNFPIPQSSVLPPPSTQSPLPQQSQSPQLSTPHPPSSLQPTRPSQDSPYAQQHSQLRMSQHNTPIPIPNQQPKSTPQQVQSVQKETPKDMTKDAIMNSKVSLKEKLKLLRSLPPPPIPQQHPQSPLPVQTPAMQSTPQSQAKQQHRSTPTQPQSTSQLRTPSMQLTRPVHGNAVQPSTHPRVSSHRPLMSPEQAMRQMQEAIEGLNAEEFSLLSPAALRSLRHPQIDHNVLKRKREERIDNYFDARTVQVGETRGNSRKTASATPVHRLVALPPLEVVQKPIDGSSHTKTITDSGIGAIKEPASSMPTPSVEVEVIPSQSSKENDMPAVHSGAKPEKNEANIEKETAKDEPVAKKRRLTAIPPRENKKTDMRKSAPPAAVPTARIDPANRLDIYKNGDVFKEFPQMEKSTNFMLTDYASLSGKTLEEVLNKNDHLWNSLGKIKDHIKPMDARECESIITREDDPDVINLLYLVAYLNGSKKNGTIDRVNRIYVKVHEPTPADAIVHLKQKSFNHPIVLKCGPDRTKHFLSIDSKAIPVEGGLRTAILSVVAATYLFDLSIDHKVGDVVRFFYHAAGLELPRVPQAVVKALNIIN